MPPPSTLRTRRCFGSIIASAAWIWCAQVR